VNLVDHVRPPWTILFPFNPSPFVERLESPSHCLCFRSCGDCFPSLAEGSLCEDSRSGLPSHPSFEPSPLITGWLNSFGCGEDIPNSRMSQAHGKLQLVDLLPDIPTRTLIRISIFPCTESLGLSSLQCSLSANTPESVLH
jgi:hypothetical protein